MGPKKKVIAKASMSSKNEDLVPDEDLAYYRKATVSGIVKQLRQQHLPANGLKYDLYQRLVDNGLRLYTDDRSSDEGDSQESDEEDDSQESDEAEESQASNEEDSSQGGDDDPDDDHGAGGYGGVDARRPRKSIAKRKRGLDGDGGNDGGANDGGGDEDDDDADAGPPRRKRRVVGSDLPGEIQTLIIQSLSPAALWNLIESAPEEYLSNAEGGINALVLEAEYQERLDHPRVPHAMPRGHPDAGPVQPLEPGDPPQNEAPDPEDDLDRPLSLLEYVARRSVYDSRFRARNRTRIMRVLDTYLTVYGPDDPPDLENNPRDRILYYFRFRPNFAAAPPRTPLAVAAQSAAPGIVHLILMRGAPVNQILGGRTALELTARLMSDANTGIAGEPFMQAVFALIGAGADVALTASLLSRQAAHSAMYELNGEDFEQEGDDFEWPRIDNPLGLTISQFIGDERSNYFDRMWLAAYVIYHRALTYPLFI